MAVLRTEKLTKCFGSMTAVNQVNLEIEKGVLHAIIGPNGAGKTTLFNLISGEFPPTSGKVYFQSIDITNHKSHYVAQLGIGRSFQITNIFPQLTVWENVWLAAFSKKKKWSRYVQRATKIGVIRHDLSEILTIFGLKEKENSIAKELTHGEQRLLEIAICLASSPTLLLLDEPTSGMALEEIPNMMKIIKNLKSQYAVLMIEHNMDVIMSISDIISVMHFGSIIAQGTPQEIQHNDKVKQAYIGLE